MGGISNRENTQGTVAGDVLRQCGNVGGGGSGSGGGGGTGGTDGDYICEYTLSYNIHITQLFIVQNLSVGL